MKSLNLNESKLNQRTKPKGKKKTRSIPKLLLIVLICLGTSLLATFLFFYVTEKRELEVFLTSYIGEEATSKIVFETYTVNLENLDENISDQVEERLLDIKHGETNRYEITETDADIHIQLIGSKSKDIVELKKQILLPVGHLYWIEDSVASEDLNGKTIIVKDGTEGNVKMALEQEGISASIFSTTNVLQELKKSEAVIGLIPLEELTYEYKLLALDGEYYLDSFESGMFTYSLGLDTSNVPDHISKSLEELTSEFKVQEELSEQDILKLNMTGVTAITRALATKTDQSGQMDYAAQKIGSFLADADLTHTSNEISFLEGCTPSGGLQFCSAPEYIAALELSGIDIVELTGNHNNDFGAQANVDSIEIYKEKGWDYFGGGVNTIDSSKILYKEVDGVKLAFIGYNYYDTIYGTGAIAGADRAGANSYSEDKMKVDIEDAKDNGAIVIVDFQFQECYSYPATDVIYPICYEPLRNPDQKGVFKKAIDLGADIVVGVQAHQPQTYELYNGKPIFYGLGNLFFDQIPWIGTRQGLVLTHYFRGEQHIQTKITTTLYDDDMKTYVTVDDDRVLLLELLRDAR